MSNQEPTTMDVPEAGAVDWDACPTRRYDGWNRCSCGECEMCGNQKHTAIHGPLLGQPPGSKPYGHEFKPIRRSLSGPGGTHGA